MSPASSSERRRVDWWAVGLALATLASRLPFMSEQLFSFDSANYAFALRDYYNVAHHQPHPPGYPLYVAVAKLVDLVVGDPNRSLVLVSIGAAAVAVVCTYRLARAQLGLAAGALAGLVLMASPGLWGYSEVAYPYTSLAAASALVALACWRMLRGAPRLAAASGVLMGVVGGIRWDALVFLLPLWLWGLWRAPAWARTLAAGGLALACLAWGVPMVLLSGGWQSYWDALRAQSGYVVGTFSLFGAGDLLLRLNLQTLVTYLRQSLGLSLLVLVFALGRVFSPWRLATDLRARYLLVWVLPPLAVYLLVHIGDPGYVLSLAPPAAILVAWTLGEVGAEVQAAGATLAARSPRWRPAARALAASGRGFGVVAAGLLCLWGAGVFLGAPGPARLPEIRSIDATLRSQIGYVRAQFDPARTLVLAHDRFRQAQYYLRGYDVRLLFDEYRPGYRLARTRIEPVTRFRHLVVLDEDAVTEVGPRGRARVVVNPDPEVSLWVFDLQATRAVEYGYRHVDLIP